MFDLRRGARFVEKARYDRLIVRVLGQEHLDRGSLADERVLGQVDNAHAAFAEFLQDAVRAYDFPQHASQTITSIGRLERVQLAGADRSALGWRRCGLRSWLRLGDGRWCGSGARC